MDEKNHQLSSLLELMIAEDVISAPKDQPIPLLNSELHSALARALSMARQNPAKSLKLCYVVRRHGGYDRLICRQSRP